MIEIISHRGASREHVENTIPAFARALDLGADAIELDVHRTLDGTIVVHHDPVLRSTAADPAQMGRPIAAMTTAELTAFRLAGGGSVPTLDEAARLISRSATLYCELKGAGTAIPACDVLARHRGSFAVHSFDHRLVFEAASHAAGVPRGVLEVSRHLDPAHSLRSVGARDLWQLAESVDESLVKEIHAAGGRVIAWTANTPELIERLAAWNVDGLCTDDIALARLVLGR